MNTTNITYARNPVLPAADREQLKFDGELENRKLSTLLRELPYNMDNLDVHVFVNDEIVPRSNWETYDLKEGENTVVLKQRLHGGDDSNPLAIIAAIALVVFTAGVASGAVLGGFTGAAAAGGATWGSLALAAGIQVAGQLIINKIFAPDVPKFDQGRKPSQTYSIGGSRNSARISGVIPLMVGTHKVVPDLGAKTFTSFMGKDVFLHQVFNFGWGNLTLSNLRIGNTDIDLHEEIQWEESGPDGVIGDFPTNVDTIAGSEMRYDDSWITRTTSPNTTRIAIDFAGTIFKVNDDGSYSYNSVTIEAQIREVGDVTWLPFKTGAGRAPGTGGRGGSGRRGRTTRDRWTIADPEDTGQTAVRKIGGSSPDPIRVSFARQVDEGQYEVRIRRTTKENDDSKYQDNLTWSQMRSFQPDTSDYTGQKRFGIVVRASGQFNGSIDQFSATVSNSIPVWDGVSTFNIEPSSNPAMIYLYLARGLFDAGGKIIAGAGLPDSQIDIEGLKEWQAWCDDNNLECNFVFDTNYTIAEMLSLVARCGRGAPTWQKGVLGVVYDEEDKPVTQQFGMSNIVKDSFVIDYITQKTADQITVKFFNADLDWQPDTVTVNVPGVTTPEAPVELELAGITTAAQAEAEANLQAARQVYTRRRVSFETDLEGLVCTRGDVISVSHDLTNWGASGRLISGTTNALVLDREVTFEFGNDYYISVRLPDGSIEIVDVSNPSTGADVVTDSISLLTPLSQSPDGDVNNNPIDYIWSFDPNETPGFKLKITGIEPVDETRIRIIAVDERPEYYAAANETPTYVVPPRYNTSPATVDNFTIVEEWQGAGKPLRLHLNWELTNADSVLLSAAGIGEDWISYGTVEALSFTLELQRYANGDVVAIQLVPQALGLLQEDQTILRVDYTISGVGAANPNITVPNVTGLTLFDDNGFLPDDGASIFTGQDAKFVWNKIGSEVSADDLSDDQENFGNLDGNFLDYEVQVLDAIGTLRRTEYVKDEQYVYTMEKNKEDGNGTPVRKFKLRVYARVQEGFKSETPASITAYNPPPLTPTVEFSVIFPQSLAVTISEPVDIDFEGIIIHVDLDSNPALPATPQPGDGTLAIRTKGVTAQVQSTVDLNDFDFDTLHQFRVAAYDQFDDTDLNYSPILFFTPTQIDSVDIADGAIDMANFAAGIRPPRVVSSLPALPDPEYPQGDTVFLTTDNKLYRSTGTTWTVEVDGPDIVANSITAGQIAAAAIGADEIAANAITTEKLAVVAYGMALNSDPYFGDEALQGQWFSNNAGTTPLGNDPEFDTIVASGGNGPSSAGRVLRGQAADSGNDQFFSDLIPLDQTKTYRVSTYARQTGTENFTNYLLVAFFDSAGANISSATSDATGWTSIGTYHYWNIANAAFPATWTQYERAFGAQATTTIPSNAVAMRVGALTLRNIVTPSDETVYFYEMKIEEVISSALIEDGAITTPKIAVDAVDADRINVNNLSSINSDMGNLTAGTITLDSVGHIKSGQTAYDSGTGFWLGRDGSTPKFSLGDSSSNNLTWDGFTLNVAGNITLQPDAVTNINIADGATMRYFQKEDSGFRNASVLQPDPTVPVWTPMWGSDFDSAFSRRLNIDFEDAASIKQFSLTGSIKPPLVNKSIYQIVPRMVMGVLIDGVFNSPTGITFQDERDAPTYKGAQITNSDLTIAPYYNFAFTARLALGATSYTIEPVVQFLADNDAVTTWEFTTFTVFDQINLVVQELRNTQ